MKEKQIKDKNLQPPPTYFNRHLYVQFPPQNKKNWQRNPHLEAEYLFHIYLPPIRAEAMKILFIILGDTIKIEIRY